MLQQRGSKPGDISLVRAVEGATLQLANVDGVWLINVTLVGTGAHLAACCCVVEMLQEDAAVSYGAAILC